MLIEASRGGHSAVVGLLLRQPKFTETLRNQILAQRQAMTSERLTTVAGKRRTRSSYSGSGGHGKKQQKSPVNKEERGIGMGAPGQGSITYGSQIINGQQFQFQPQPQPQPQPQHQPQPQLQSQSQLSNQSLQQQVIQNIPSSVLHTCSSSPQKINPSLSTSEDVFIDQPPVQLEPVHTIQENDSTGSREKIKGSVRWPQDDMKLFEPSEFTVNPSYKFGHAPTGSHIVQPMAGLSIPHGSVAVDTTTPTISGNYLLPSIFAQSPAYSNQEHMEAYMKADEILRNHMLQLDYAKQQALMNALESLMLQSESHRASIGMGEAGGGGESVRSGESGGGVENIVLSLNNSPIKLPDGEREGHDGQGGGGKSGLSEGVDTCSGDHVGNTEINYSPLKDPLNTQLSGPPPWSITDPSRMPQFSMGVSTLAHSTNSPEKQSPKSSRHSPNKHHTALDKQSLAAFQTQMLASLERANLYNPSLLAPDTNIYTTTYAPMCEGIVSQGSAIPNVQVFNSIDTPCTTTTTQSIGMCENQPLKLKPESRSSSSPLPVSPDVLSDPNQTVPLLNPPCSTMTSGSSSFQSESSVLSSIHNSLQQDSNTGTQSHNLYQLPVPLSHGQYLQPIYSPDLAGLKHLTHRVLPPGSENPSLQQFDEHGRPHPLASSVWLDANFPLDIPPPSDLIPEHVSNICIYNYYIIIHVYMYVRVHVYYTTYNCTCSHVYNMYTYYMYTHLLHYNIHVHTCIILYYTCIHM